MDDRNGSQTEIRIPTWSHSNYLQAICPWTNNALALSVCSVQSEVALSLALCYLINSLLRFLDVACSPFSYFY